MIERLENAVGSQNPGPHGSQAELSQLKRCNLNDGKTIEQRIAYARGNAVVLRVHVLIGAQETLIEMRISCSQFVDTRGIRNPGPTSLANNRAHVEKRIPDR